MELGVRQDMDFEQYMLSLCPTIYWMIFKKDTYPPFAGGVFQWDDMREVGASLTMFEFAVDLGWNCLQNSCTALLHLKPGGRLLYWLCPPPFA